MGIKNNVAKMSDHVWNLYNNITDYDDTELENEIKKIAILLDYIYKGLSYEKALEEYTTEGDN